MLIAIDDTDSLEGGCTTHLAFGILLALPELALQGMPRLVRLNPNVPWKTRGNGAIVIPVCVPEGPEVDVGEFRGHHIKAFPEGREPAHPEQILARVLEVVKAQSQSDAKPGVAVLREAPPAFLYSAGVTTQLELDDALSLSQDLGVFSEPQQGLVGALAAAAWPGPPSSFELLAYREPNRWGTPRAVEVAHLQDLDQRGTFHTWDPDAQHATCIPQTPCPVLLGLRGRDPELLKVAALRRLPLACKEPIDGWLLWASNQASGDHVVALRSVLDAPTWATVEVPVRIEGMPEPTVGGRVSVAATDSAGMALQLVAFEPTKRFRTSVQELRPGDEIIARGAWKEGAVQLEAFCVVELAPRQNAKGPMCCEKRMKSRGAGAGYKCAVCGAKAGMEDAELVDLTCTLGEGWYEVPISARRHLHRPVAFDS